MGRILMSEARPVGSSIQAPNLCPLSVSNYRDDEIDLLSLLVDVWQQRWFIGGAVSVIGALALVLLLALPSTYEVTAEIEIPSAVSSPLLPALYQQIDTLENLENVPSEMIGEDGNMELPFVLRTPSVGSNPLLAQHRFNRVYQLLKSRDMWLAYQKKTGKTFSAEQGLQAELGRFKGALSVTVLAPQGKKNQSITNPTVLGISLRGGGDEKLARELEGFLQFVNERVVTEVSGGQQIILKGYRDSVENQISLIQLQNQVGPMKDSTAGKGQDAGVASMPATAGLAYGLTQLQSSLQQLQNFSPDLAGLKGFQYLSHPLGEGEKIKPKKALILAATLLFAGFLAIVLALLRTALQRRKEAM
ncbi:unknown protein [Desulfotalea psychrophila LSv54]|uniref:Polysaccharide chain length determinant N-terminal domain-containing protein n=2 Tax=Desulfotalea psychrophila TaxID=84980 RepID=Q6AS85_DESPS|nr:unknown protein [Desulfotalea psychrophila LSv54]